MDPFAIAPLTVNVPAQQASPDQVPVPVMVEPLTVRSHRSDEPGTSLSRTHVPSSVDEESPVESLHASATTESKQIAVRRRFLMTAEPRLDTVGHTVAAAGTP